MAETEDEDQNKDPVTFKARRIAFEKDANIVSIEQILEEARKKGLKNLNVITDLSDDEIRNRVESTLSMDPFRALTSEDIPLSLKQGRLQYSLGLDAYKLKTLQVGWTDKKDYVGNALAIQDGRVYLTGITFFARPENNIVLNLTNTPQLFGKKPEYEPISSEQARELLVQAEKVINLLLKNPSSRSADPYYGGYHAADLILIADAATRCLNVNFNNFKTGSSQVNGRYFGNISNALAKVNERTGIVLVKEGEYEHGSMFEQINYAASQLFR